MLFNKYVFFLFLLFSIQGIAQVEVKGKLIEKNSKEPIEQATIRLLNAKDSSLISGSVSGKNGQFSIKSVKPGNYLLLASFIGFESVYLPLQITGKTNPVQIGTLEMDDEGVLLDEAVVTAKAVDVMVRNDTVEYNADSYKVAEGSALEDLLKKMPGVEIDSEGKVTVNGKEIKKIMVDGKEFFSDDPKVASKNLPAKMVDKVQVLDKKSDMAIMTGFDDGNEETVINLTVKPGMKRGWFGNAFAGYGSKERYEGNVMVNRFLNKDQFTLTGGLNNTNNMGFTDIGSSMFSGMGSGRRRMMRGVGGNGITTSANLGSNFSKQLNPKLIFGGNIRYSQSDNLSENSDLTEFLQTSLHEYNSGKSNTVNDNLGANFRLEWNPDTLTRLVFQPDFNYSKTIDESNDNSHTLKVMQDTPPDSINKANANSYSNGEGYSFSGNLDFSRKLNNKGRTFSASFSAGLNDSYSNGMNQSTTYYLTYPDSVVMIDQKVRYDQGGQNFRAFASWVEPLGRNNFLQASYRFSQNQRESLKNSFNQDEVGNYTELDTTYSKNTRNKSIEQRASLSFKAVRPKYSYTVGFNMDPSYSQTESFIGDKVLHTQSRNVMNFSPSAQLDYRFDNRANLRIDYDGRTSQPSMQQLEPVPDVTNPLNTVMGNPDLKPTYTNSLRFRFQKFVPENQSAFIVMINGNYVLNAIVNNTVTDNQTGKKVITYENVNGNYGGDARIIFNTPLKNKKFTINTMTWGRFGQSKGFNNGLKNISDNLTLMERAEIYFRSKVLDFGINGNIRYNQIDNSIQTRSNVQTFNYGGGASTTIYLPYTFQIESDVNYSANSGYSNGYEQKEWLWNASVSKSIFKNNAGTLRLKFYDILQQRSNISQSSTASYTRHSEYNTINSYFMAYFIYRFSVFSGGASEADARRGETGRFRDRGDGSSRRN